MGGVCASEDLRAFRVHGLQALGCNCASGLLAFGVGFHSTQSLWGSGCRGFGHLGLWVWGASMLRSIGATYMGSCQNYGPFLGTLNIRCHIILGTQKGTIILTTTHMEDC